ncbi:MAG: hypothetical protein CL609_11740 [Anaerolineaceae bacterium]|nr:hypothetical protein [Anaerolineaceae bacterium]
MKKILKMGLVQILIGLILITVLSSTVKSARADIAPPGPPTSPNPEPEFETMVRMVSETVIMEIDADSPYDEGLVHVSAEFTMRNLGENEEEMLVRFPLDLAPGGWTNYCSSPSPFGSSFSNKITNFYAWINDYPVPTYQTTHSFDFEFELGKITKIVIPCWENFTVKFPPQEDVHITVTYDAYPYTESGSGLYDYSYVLETGRGWYDTIGTAEIIIQFPYSLDEFNYSRPYPPDYTISNNQIKWYFENLEPDHESNISASVFPPSLWQRVLMETQKTQDNPNDGEAWGRLGKAYKEGIRGRRGFRSDPEDLQLYLRSKEAYQQAIQLLPFDADWHYGYSELLCEYAEWGHDTLEDWKACINELKQTLELNPNHEKGLIKAYEMAEYFPDKLSINEGELDYLILTPQTLPTITATTSIATPTTIPTQVPSLTPTQAITITTQPPTATAISPTPSIIPDQENTAETHPALPWFTLALLPVIGLFIIWLIIKMKNVNR